MSDIRYNSWLHRSGTGGVYQDSSGNVGIGTSVGMTSLINSGPNALTFGTGTTPAERARITTTGQLLVGINNAVSSDVSLQLHSASSGTGPILNLTNDTGDCRIFFGQDSSSSDANAKGQLRYNVASDYLVASTAATERVRIDSSGHVGVTSASPVATRFSGTVSGLINLAGTKPCVYISETDVKDSSGTNRALYMGLSGGTAYAGSNAPFSFATGDTTTTERVRIDTAGNVNITGVCTSKTFSPSEGQLGHRNYIINGSMYYWQRGTSGTNMSTNAYLCDRFKAMSSSDGEGAISRDTDVPTANEAGTRFVYSLKVDVTTADTSLAAGQYAIITQRIEGRQILDLGFGLAGTRYATLSFWVKAPAGTYGVSFRNASYNRSYVAEYTVSSANTWEKKTMTIPVDTSGTWAHDNTTGLDIQWSLAAGSTFQGSAGSWSGSNYHSTSNQYNLYSSTSNNFFLTGAQFERGSTSTPFEWRGEAEELRRVQRYYWGFHAPGTQIGLCNAMARTSDMFMSVLEHPVQMRASPSLVTSTTAGHHEVVWKNSQGDCNNSGITTPGGTYLRDFSYPIAGTLNSGSFGSDALFVQLNGAGTVAFNAEL